MKALCMVAHPDDCVIFAYSLMRHTPHVQWSVCYLTYDRTHERGREMQNFWLDRRVETIFLGYNDDWRDIETDRPSFDTNRARNDIHDVCKFADVILTHDKNGDYGHPHHRFVHRCVELLSHDNVITFAPPGQGTHRYTIDPIDYDAVSLPLHWSTIKEFHTDTHTNAYSMSEKTAKDLGV